MNKMECVIFYYEFGSYFLFDFISYVMRFRDFIYYSINYDDI